MYHNYRGDWLNSSCALRMEMCGCSMNLVFKPLRESVYESLLRLCGRPLRSLSASQERGWSCSLAATVTSMQIIETANSAPKHDSINPSACDHHPSSTIATSVLITPLHLSLDLFITETPQAYIWEFYVAINTCTSHVRGEQVAW